MAFIGALGIVAGTLGLVSFGLNNFPDEPFANGALIRVHAGLGEDKSQTMGGDIWQIFGYDYYNNFLGQSELNYHVGDGGYADIEIMQDLGETTASRYIDLKSGHDATCIVYITTTQPDDFERTWLGDVGYLCGQTFYESGYTVGTDEDGNNYQPYCMWLDGNGDPTKSVSMKIDTEYYEVNENSEIDPEMDVCKGTIWTEDYYPIPEVPEKRGMPEKRSIPLERNINKKRPAQHDTTLVVSSFERSSAANLCAHGNSMGPDFVALKENSFCDMDAKQLYPLCSKSVTSDCFDMDVGDINVGGGKFARSGPRYEKRIDW